MLPSTVSERQWSLSSSTSTFCRRRWNVPELNVNDISDGAGLLMGKNSQFKNIPILGWLL